MKKNTLLGNWTGSVDSVETAIARHNEWKRKRRIGLGIAFGVLLVMILLAAITNRRELVAVSAILVVFCVLGTLAVQFQEPDLDYVEKYHMDRDRLANAIGMKPEELEAMDYDRLRNGIVLPTLDGLFVKMRAQVGNNYRAEAAATYRELDNLHSACPRFRLLNGTTDGRYALESFDFYLHLLVSA